MPSLEPTKKGSPAGSDDLQGSRNGHGALRDPTSAHHGPMPGLQNIQAGHLRYLDVEIDLGPKSIYVKEWPLGRFWEVVGFGVQVEV